MVNTYRDAQDEIAVLRQELDETKAEVDRLRDAVRHIVDMVNQGTPTPQIHHAVVELRRFVGPEVTS